MRSFTKKNGILKYDRFFFFLRGDKAADFFAYVSDKREDNVEDNVEGNYEENVVYLELEFWDFFVVRSYVYMCVQYVCACVCVYDHMCVYVCVVWIVGLLQFCDGKAVNYLYLIDAGWRQEWNKRRQGSKGLRSVMMSINVCLVKERGVYV